MTGDERHGQRLEQEREAGAQPRPGHGDLLDAAVEAGDARRPRVQEGLVLAEVEMPPFLHRGVVHRAVGLGAAWTREAAAAREVDLDVEALAFGVEVARLDHPRRHQAMGKLKQVGVAHGMSGAGIDHGAQRAAASVVTQGQALT